MARRICKTSALLTFLLFTAQAGIMGNWWKNMPMQYDVIFHAPMNVNFQMKLFDIFLICVPNMIFGTC